MFVFRLSALGVQISSVFFCIFLQNALLIRQYQRWVGQNVAREGTLSSLLLFLFTAVFTNHCLEVREKRLLQPLLSPITAVISSYWLEMRNDYKSSQLCLITAVFSSHWLEVTEKCLFKPWNVSYRVAFWFAVCMINKQGESCEYSLEEMLLSNTVTWN